MSSTQERMAWPVWCLMGLVEAAIEEWSVCNPERRLPCLPVEFPFSVHETLWRAGVIENPFKENAQPEIDWIGQSEWILSGLLAEPLRDALLRISGVTAPADVLCDRQSCGSINSGFVDYEFLISARSEISIVLHSPQFAAINGIINSSGLEVPKCPPEDQHGFCGIQFLRIPQYLFGWDWGLATSSLSVTSLELLPHPGGACIGTGRVEVRTRLLDGHVWELTVTGLPITAQETLVSLTSPDGELVFSGVHKGEELTVSVSDPDLWWPRGHGSQNLYTLSFCQTSCSCVSKTIGFRTVRAYTEPGKWRLLVNNVPVYLTGANVVPTSAFRDSTNAEVEKLFSDVIALNGNVLRQWGGGWYASEFLYTRADELGILVWEEIKLACATYPVDQSGFLDDLAKEVMQHIARGRGHASLAIVSGDNEIDMMLTQNWYSVEAPALQELRDRYNVLRSKVAADVAPDGHFVFIPSSPEPGVDLHYYAYSVDCRDWTALPDNTALVSEYGFQSAASASYLEQFMIDPKTELSREWNESKFLKNRQHRKNGTAEVAVQIGRVLQDLHGTNWSAEEYIWYSQISQSICLKASTEGFRRQDSNSGLLVWQLNDVWPTISWSLTGFDGVRKPGFFAVREAFAADFASLYMDGADLVVGTRRGATGTVMPINVYIVDMLNGSVASFTTKTTNVDSLEYKELGRFNLASVCPNRECVAATSPTNYVLLGSVDRRMHRYDSVENPVFVLSEYGSSAVKLRAQIPVPFTHITCKGQSISMRENSVFLAPGLWDEFEIETTRGELCLHPEVMTFWNFTKDASATDTYRIEIA